LQFPDLSWCYCFCVVGGGDMITHGVTSFCLGNSLVAIAFNR
jgi:hypothetical protein